MRKFPAWLLFSPVVLYGQTAETALFRAVMLPSNEVPAVNSNARGTTDIIVSVMRDPSGQIVSGTVDFLARVTFPAAAVVTGLDMRNAAAGLNGSVVFTTGLSAANSRPLQINGDTIHIPVQVAAENTAGVAALRSLLQDPSKFYVNLLTADFPNGVMRGQLQRAQVAVRMGLMSSDNVVTATANTATGVAEVVAIGTRDAGGNWTSGEVYMTASYVSDDQTTINGFHIHFGGPGSTGAIGIGPAPPPGLASDPNGSVLIGPLTGEVALNNSAQTGAFTNLFVNPTSLYIDVHTTANTGGVLRAQLRPTDSMSFPVVLDSTNEVVTPGVEAAAVANLTLYTLRNEDGSIAAGAWLCDMDYRFPGPAQVLGLYIHDAPPTADGPISIKVTPDFNGGSGFGNYYNWSPPISNLAALTDIVKNPQNHYLDLHTLDDPSGAARAQLAPAVGLGKVAAAISANLDKNATTVAPGGLISIFGSNLAKVATDLSGWTGKTLPILLNGVAVDIAGKHAPLIYVSSSQINAQVPVDLPPGVTTVQVDNGNGLGTAYSVNVAPTAPAIFFYPAAAVLKNVNYSLVSGSNPAHVGDVLLVYATGLGQTNPPVTTGALVTAGVVANTAPVTATIGGRNASVAYAIASPQFVGLYQVAVTVPAGLSGNMPVVIQQSGATSNSVMIPVQ